MKIKFVVLIEASESRVHRPKMNYKYETYKYINQ